MARILSVDPGGTTGIAWTEDGTLDPTRSGLWLLSQHKAPGDRYCTLLDRLKHAEVKPTHIAFEKAGKLRSHQAEQWFAGYLAIVQLYAEWIGAECLTIAPSTLKKWATGSGVASKEARAENPNIEKERMRSALCWRYPKFEALGHIDHNRIDALWVLAWAIETVGR